MLAYASMLEHLLRSKLHQHNSSRPSHNCNILYECNNFRAALSVYMFLVPDMKAKNHY